MASTQHKLFQFKLVLLGEAAVGKSSLVLRFVKGEFVEFQESTIGAAFLTQTVPLQDAIVKFEIWDTAGQERYHSLAPMYYRGAHAAVVVFDITRTDSYTRAQEWVRELQRKGNPDVVIALVGNKADLSSKREVQEASAHAWAEENNLLYFEASAKTAQGVHEIFQGVARKLPTSGPGVPNRARGAINLSSQVPQKGAEGTPGAPQAEGGCCS